MTLSGITLSLLPLPAVRLFQGMEIALLAAAAFHVVTAGASVLMHHLTAC